MRQINRLLRRRRAGGAYLPVGGGRQRGGEGTRRPTDPIATFEKVGRGLRSAPGLEPADLPRGRGSGRFARNQRAGLAAGAKKIFTKIDASGDGVPSKEEGAEGMKLMKKGV